MNRIFEFEKQYSQSRMNRIYDLLEEQSGEGDTDTLQAITILSLLTNDVKNRIDQLGSFGVMALGPIVSGTGLAKNEIIGAKDLTVGTGSDTVHSTGLKIHENSPGNVSTARSLIVIDIDPLQLKIGGRIAVVLSGGVDAVLIADDFPELGSDLVAALATLNVKNLSHGIFLFFYGD